ncbi:hypothetical protein H6P81_010796 [Aristolochia fimbriata]|uniref:Uncharacterized protein n=1 Tax=Aristolochia fimbriata TaxID=158543 RepID=A0AAV7EQW9_ARIFI|nr:hypothetical protein H6P81_010796 [Aristolochia fimbriata]
MDNQPHEGTENDSKSGSAKSQKAELKAALCELAHTKKEVEQARDAAAKSWLESKPLFDELDRIQLDLSKANSRVSKATTTISTIESQLVATNASIRSKQEDERERRRRIQEVKRHLDQRRGNVAMLHVEVTEERLAQTKLKQEHRFRRQSLQALQLRHRAARMETDICRASARSARRSIKHFKEEKPTVELQVEEYKELTRKANEQTTLADWRVSISMEQRRAAEKQQEKALRRLNEVHAHNWQMKAPKARDTAEEQDYIRNQQHLIPSTSQHNRLMQAKDREKSTTISKVPQRIRASKSGSTNKKIIKKPSVLGKIRSFLLRHIRKFFG